MYNAEEMVDGEVGFDDRLWRAVSWSVVFGKSSGNEERLCWRDFVARELKELDPVMQLRVRGGA